MSLEKIVEKIIADAEAESERILQESRKKAVGIKAEALRDVEERAAAYLQEEERAANLEASRILTQARLEKRLRILAEKRELVAGVLKKVFEGEALRHKDLRRKIILKDGIREEPFSREKLLEELSSRLENDILEALKI